MHLSQLFDWNMYLFAHTRWTFRKYTRHAVLFSHALAKRESPPAAAAAADSNWFCWVKEAATSRCTCRWKRQFRLWKLRWFRLSVRNQSSFFGTEDSPYQDGSSFGRLGTGLLQNNTWSATGNAPILQPEPPGVYQHLQHPASRLHPRVTVQRQDHLRDHVPGDFRPGTGWE